MKKEKKLGPIEAKIKKSLDKIDDLLHEDLLKPSHEKGPLDRFDDLLHKDLKQIIKSEDDGKESNNSVFRYIEILLKDRFVATVSPSSKFVIRRVLKALDLKHARVVVEYGPADGVITQPIL